MGTYHKLSFDVILKRAQLQGTGYRLHLPPNNMYCDRYTPTLHTCMYIIIIIYVPIRVKTSCLCSRAFSVRPSVHPSIHPSARFCVYKRPTFSRAVASRSHTISAIADDPFIITYACVCVWAACNNNIVYTVAFVVCIVVLVYVYLYIMLLLLHILCVCERERERAKNGKLRGIVFFSPHYPLIVCGVRAA